jgi:hypothetical protein
LHKLDRHARRAHHPAADTMSGTNLYNRMLRGERDLAKVNLVRLPHCLSCETSAPAPDPQNDSLAWFCEGGVPFKLKCSIAAKCIRQHDTQPLLFRVHSSVLLT